VPVDVMKECNGRRGIPPLILTLAIKGGSSQIYEGWNFNSGNYLFTTDTK